MEIGSGGHGNQTPEHLERRPDGEAGVHFIVPWNSMVFDEFGPQKALLSENCRRTEPEAGHRGRMLVLCGHTHDGARGRGRR
jgi:hypothetical protein